MHHKICWFGGDNPEFGEHLKRVLEWIGSLLLRVVAGS
jgi:hypothetical protein